MMPGIRCGRMCRVPGQVARGFLAGLVVLMLWLALDRRVAAEPAPAYGPVSLPVGVDSVTSLDQALERVVACPSECTGVLYFWTPRMPLSRSGIPQIWAAARASGASLTLVDLDELARRGDGTSAASVPVGEAARVERVTEAVLRAGALAHAPSFVVHRNGRIVGPAVLGYKTAEAYASLIERRLTGTTSGRRGEDGPSAWRGRAPTVASQVVEHVAIGLPGAYFRVVPGSDALAYESDQRVYLLDLHDGESRRAPGFIDFVPTPDGRYFVTPAPGDGGLAFYDATEVFAVAGTADAGSVEPIFTDLRMRDQYPSVGILGEDEEGTRYRILTSWFDGIVYRDYLVRRDATSDVASVRPLDEPVEPCEGYALSTPIMSRDGREVSARDEETGTTKIFEMLDDQGCREVIDLGTATTKVAWNATGRRIAFAIPRRRVRVPSAPADETGIFVFDRDTEMLTRVPGSDGSSRLAFPDWVSDREIVFLVPRESVRGSSVFRIVAAVP